MTFTNDHSYEEPAKGMKKRKHHEVYARDDAGNSSSNEEEDQLGTLHIVVRRVGKSEAESLQIELDSAASVLDLKAKITETLEAAENEVVVPVERQRLIFSGKMLRDEAQALDTIMNAEEDQKYFVHMTPLPKGAAPSVRTERELAENPLGPSEERARSRQRRRRRQEPRRDPAAYHPYALDLTSGSFLPAADRSTAASLAASVASAEEAALFSVAAAAEQSRLVQEVARRNVLPDALQAVVLAQQHQNLLAAASGAAGGVSMATNPLCPLAGQADAAVSLLERSLLVPRTDSAINMLRYAHPHLAGATAGTNIGLSTTQEAAIPAAAALQDMLTRPGLPQGTALPEFLDQIALNAGELATTLRLLSPGHGTPAATALPHSPAPTATVSALSTPQDLATRLALEERIASLSSPGSYLGGGYPGLY